jgi:superfamily I DNA and RNA helicase
VYEFTIVYNMQDKIKHFEQLIQAASTPDEAEKLIKEISDITDHNFLHPRTILIIKANGKRLRLLNELILDAIREENIILQNFFTNEARKAEAFSEGVSVASGVPYFYNPNRKAPGGAHDNRSDNVAASAGTPDRVQ